MKFETKIGEKKIEIEIKNWAERANGEVIARQGDTQVLATAVMSEGETRGLGFFPLTVNYEERYYAAGKILGSRYIRREARPSDNAVLTSRLIDRTIRPGFNKELKREVQVIITCLSWDEENDPDVLGILAASLALSVSDIPWRGPNGAVRVGLGNGKFILNPSYLEREECSLDIIFAGPKGKKEPLMNMIEGSGEEISEEQIIKAWESVQPSLEKLIQFQEDIVKQIGKEKIKIEKAKDPVLEREMKRFLKDKLEKAVYPKPKEKGPATKLNQLKRELSSAFEEDQEYAQEFFEKEVERIIHQNIIEKNKRPDGRKADQLRPIACEAGIIPRAHGSSIFSRGITKSLSILTLGGPGDQQLIEGMEIRGKKRFLHHYNFPPYSVGEVRFLRAPSRRDIGHGMLAEKALRPLIPELDQFPYTIRVVSEILSSNGSTSMAATCSLSLALMDAGVPIKRPVAGIALGLMKNNNNYKVLTDIQGPEDFHGDMDLKVAGTRQGITALQMDVKIPGIDKKILKEALARAKDARRQILDSMEKVLPKPRSRLSPFAPKIFQLQINPEKIGVLIGTKGQTIKKIAEETQAAIDVDDSGLVYVTTEDEEQAKKAIALIKNITREIKVGETCLGKVKRVLGIGTMVEVSPGKEGLIPNSQLSERLKVGQKISVKVISIDERGRINLRPQNASFRRTDHGRH